MDMLPARKAALSPVLPLSTRPSLNDINPMLDSSAIVEVEARNPPVPEVGADAPGPHIQEVETVERIREMDSRRSIAELEGRSGYATEL